MRALSRRKDYIISGFTGIARLDDDCYSPVAPPPAEHRVAAGGKHGASMTPLWNNGTLCLSPGGVSGPTR